MPIYISILDGPDPYQAQQILATSNPELVAAIGELIAQRLGVKVPSRLLHLRDFRKNDGEDGDER